jgi:hypothetical protein
LLVINHRIVIGAELAVAWVGEEPPRAAAFLSIVLVILVSHNRTPWDLNDPVLKGKFIFFAFFEFHPGGSAFFTIAQDDHFVGDDLNR